MLLNTRMNSAPIAAMSAAKGCGVAIQAGVNPPASRSRKR